MDAKSAIRKSAALFFGCLSSNRLGSTSKADFSGRRPYSISVFARPSQPEHATIASLQAGEEACERSSRQQINRLPEGSEDEGDRAGQEQQQHTPGPIVSLTAEMEELCRPNASLLEEADRIEGTPRCCRDMAGGKDSLASHERLQAEQAANTVECEALPSMLQSLREQQAAAGQNAAAQATSAADEAAIAKMAKVLQERSLRLLKLESVVMSLIRANTMQKKLIEAYESKFDEQRVLLQAAEEQHSQQERTVAAAYQVLQKLLEQQQAQLKARLQQSASSSGPAEQPVAEQQGATEEDVTAARNILIEQLHDHTFQLGEFLDGMAAILNARDTLEHGDDCETASPSGLCHHAETTAARVVQQCTGLCGKLAAQREAHEVAAREHNTLALEVAALREAVWRLMSLREAEAAAAQERLTQLQGELMTKASALDAAEQQVCALQAIFQAMQLTAWASHVQLLELRATAAKLRADVMGLTREAGELRTLTDSAFNRGGDKGASVSSQGLAAVGCIHNISGDYAAASLGNSASSIYGSNPAATPTSGPVGASDGCPTVPMGSSPPDASVSSQDNNSLRVAAGSYPSTSSGTSGSSAAATVGSISNVGDAAAAAVEIAQKEEPQPLLTRVLSTDTGRSRDQHSPRESHFKVELDTSSGSSLTLELGSGREHRSARDTSMSGGQKGTAGTAAAGIRPSGGKAGGKAHGLRPGIPSRSRGAIGEIGSRKVGGKVDSGRSAGGLLGRAPADVRGHAQGSMSRRPEAGQAHVSLKSSTYSGRF